MKEKDLVIASGAQVQLKLSQYDKNCLHKATDILKRNIESPPSLIALARLAGINDNKLKRGFKQLFGTTVRGYLHSLRMEEARKLLEQSSLQISQVSRQVGFNNVGYFAAKFKECYQCKPKEYRKKFH